MTYSIIYDGNSYELPSYNAGTVDKIDKVKATLQLKQTQKDKCKSMYDFIVLMLGKDDTVSMLGAFTDADFNAISIVYESIIDAYSKPLTEYKANKTVDMLNELHIDDFDKLTNILQSIDKSN